MVAAVANQRFAAVSAYRRAVVRILLALITLIWGVPALPAVVDHYVETSFHIPVLSGLPIPPSWSILALKWLWPLAVGCLLIGLFSRIAAGFLAVTGMWLMLLDTTYFSNNLYFHLTLLILLTASNDRISLGRLVRHDDGADLTCPGWAERVLVAQAAIVFLYAALDKVFSPFWGVRGLVISEIAAEMRRGGQVHLDRPFPLSLAHDGIRLLLEAAPGTISLSVIGAEVALAIAFIVPKLRVVAIVAASTLAAFFQFVLRPGYFVWDIIALLFLLSPVGDRRYVVPYEETCSMCRRIRGIMAPLDWLRRIGWIRTHGRVHTVHPTILDSQANLRRWDGALAICRLIGPLSPLIYVVLLLIHTLVGLLGGIAAQNNVLIVTVAGLTLLFATSAVIERDRRRGQGDLESQLSAPVPEPNASMTAQTARDVPRASASLWHQSE